MLTIKTEKQWNQPKFKISIDPLWAFSILSYYLSLTLSTLFYLSLSLKSISSPFPWFPSHPLSHYLFFFCSDSIGLCYISLVFFLIIYYSFFLLVLSIFLGIFFSSLSLSIYLYIIIYFSFPLVPSIFLLSLSLSCNIFLHFPLWYLRLSLSLDTHFWVNNVFPLNSCHTTKAFLQNYNKVTAGSQSNKVSKYKYFF